MKHKQSLFFLIILWQNGKNTKEYITNMSMSKLDVKLDYRTVKFTDYAIEKYQYNFDIIKAKRIGIKLSCYKDF